MGFFDNIFKGSEPGEKKEEVKQKKEEVATLESEFLNAKKDIKLLEEKYDDFIARSLEVDFDEFKAKMNVVFPNYPKKEYFWFIEECRYGDMTLKKFQKNESGRDDDVTLKVSYKFDESTASFTVEKLYVTIGYQNITLKTYIFQKIIQKYFMHIKIKEINQLRDSSKKSYEKMINMVGKDVKRDSLIDQILSK